MNLDLLVEFRAKCKADLFSKEPCTNNNHYFVKYDDGNVICSKCGRFAKIGRLYMKEGDKK